MAVDWSRGDLGHSLSVQLVDPTDLRSVRGELAGVTGGTLSLDYHADSRMSARLATVDRGDHGWDGTAAFRLVHVVSDWTGELLREVLGTFWADPEGPVSWERSGEVRACAWALDGILRRFEWQVPSGGLTVAHNASALAVMRSVFASCSAEYRIDGTAMDCRLKGPTVYAPSSQNSYLRILSEACARAGDRLDVDADGTAVVRGYVAPSARPPDLEVWADGPRGTLVGPMGGGDAGLALPSRVVVVAAKDRRVVSGIASAPATARQHQSHRGYSYDSVHEENDLAPFTRVQAEARARQYLDEESAEDRRLEVGMMYAPLREGDVVLLHMDGEARRWQVSSADLDLAAWTWRLNLRGGWS